MARPKTKEGKKMSFNIKTEINERLHKYCDETGRSLTAAVERFVSAGLDEYDKEQKKQ